MNEESNIAANPNQDSLELNNELYFFIDWIPQGIANPDATNVQIESVKLEDSDHYKAFAYLLKDLYSNDAVDTDQYLEDIYTKSIYLNYKKLVDVEKVYIKYCSKVVLGLREDGFIILCLVQKPPDSQGDGSHVNKVQQMSNLAAWLLDVIKDLTGHTHLFHKPLVPRTSPIKMAPAESNISKIEDLAFTPLQTHDLEPIRIANDSIFLPPEESIEHIVKRILDTKPKPQSQGGPKLESLIKASNTKKDKTDLAVNAIAMRYSEVREHALRLAQLQEYWKLPKAVNDIKDAVTTWAFITILMFLLVYFFCMTENTVGQYLLYTIFGLSGPIYMFISWRIKCQLEKNPSDSYTEQKEPLAILSRYYFFVVIPGVLMFLLFLNLIIAYPEILDDNIKDGYVPKIIENLPYISFVLLVFSVIYLKSIVKVYLIEKNYISILQRAKGFLAYGNIYIKTLTNALTRARDYTTQKPHEPSWGNFDASIDTLNTSIETRELYVKESLFRHRVVALFFGLFTGLFAVLTDVESDPEIDNGQSEVIAQIKEATEEIKDDTKHLADIKTKIDTLPDHHEQIAQQTGEIKADTGKLGAVKENTDKLPDQFDKTDKISDQIKIITEKLAGQKVKYLGTIVPGIEDSCRKSAPLAVLFFDYGSSTEVKSCWIEEEGQQLNDYREILDNAENSNNCGPFYYDDKVPAWINKLVHTYQEKHEDGGYLAIIGYADRSGNPQNNLVISQKRAEYVLDRISENNKGNKINTSQILKSWLGEEYITVEGKKIMKPAAAYSRRASLHWCKEQTDDN